MKILLCFAAFLLLAAADEHETIKKSTVEACIKKYSCKANHTLCKYPYTLPVSTCGIVLYRGFTDEEKIMIVQQHNRYRARVAAGLEKRGDPGPQPPARDMKTLVWDDQLAMVAQRWADQCQLAKDLCRNDESDKYVGQNEAWDMWHGDVGPQFSQLVDKWYNEVRHFDRRHVTKFTSYVPHRVKHYTQMVWADSHRIGCGKIIFRPSSEVKIRSFLVCNYEPGGNVMNKRIYHIVKYSH